MYYYAVLDAVTHVCLEILALDYELTDINPNETIQISSNDTSLIGKVYNFETQQFEDPNETTNCTIETSQIKQGNRRLDLFLGDVAGLSVGENTPNNLVAAINQVFQSASDGKTAIANAIAGVDDSLTIPDNPTFAQLAALIGQLGGMNIATGHTQAYTSSNTTISGQTSFRPRIVAFYNNQTGSTNFNAGLYLDSDYFGLTKDAADVQDFPDINFNAWGVSGGGHAENVFTITDTGFTATVTGVCTNIGWIALG